MHLDGVKEIFRVETTAPRIASSTTRDLFRLGNFVGAARTGDAEAWQTYASLGLIGKPREALAGLAKFDGPEPAFYAAVTRWIDGDDAGALAALEGLAPYHAHARNLAHLIRKPTIHVLAQLPWSRTGCSDLLAGLKHDPKFQVENISFHPDDRLNAPHADIHSFYDPEQPPDFYACQMIEWHLLPPNLAELPCPVLGQTADYDLHIQTIHPWLQLFDELIVTDPSEWEDVRRLAPSPVSTFPKTFGLPASLAPLTRTKRELDLFLSGTVTHPYHPDKAILLHQIQQVANAKMKIVNGFRAQDDYHRNLSSTKVCVTYVRHATAAPTRGLEALAMGCGLVVQRGSVLSLFAGESEGVLTYDLAEGDLPNAVQKILENWPEFAKRAERGAALVRQEFSLARVASQYLRFLTFLAARPRQRPRAVYADGLNQKRVVLQMGWLPDYNFDSSVLLRHLGLANYNRLMPAIEAGPATSHPFIDAARESVLYNFHRVRKPSATASEWLASVTALYRRGLEAFPRSLVLRFNFIRVLLHFGGEAERAEALRLLDETLLAEPGAWPLDINEDVFPWDFFPQLFNYRTYFDLVTKQLTHGEDCRPQLRHLIYASLCYYRGFFAPYQGFYNGGLDYFRRAVGFDPEFPYYQFHYARELLLRGQPSDDVEACEILIRLAEQSILFLDAFELLCSWNDGRRPQLSDTMPVALEEKKVEKLLPAAPEVRSRLRNFVDRNRTMMNRAKREIDFAEPIAPYLVPASFPESITPKHGEDRWMVKEQVERLRHRIAWMETSHFWKMRDLWIGLRKKLGMPTKDYPDGF